VPKAEEEKKDSRSAMSAVGRRLGISLSLMAQYINGIKKPSKEREQLIMAEIAAIGKELQAIKRSW
jgi:hypothetical protein